MVEEWVNAAGGIQGHPLKLIVEDSKSDEGQAVLAVRKLLEKDKVMAIIGPSATGESMAVVPIMEKAGTPLISCAAALSIVTPKDELDRILAAKTFEMPKKQNKWIFKTAQTDTSAVEAIYDHMKKKGITRVAIITVTAGFGDFGRQELKRVAPVYGISIVADERYGPKDSDMTAQLTKIKGTDAQALINWSVGPAASHRNEKLEAARHEDSALPEPWISGRREISNWPGAQRRAFFAPWGIWWWRKK